MERIEPMLALLREAWLRHPDQRLGQLVVNVARENDGSIRDVFDVEDEMWAGLRREASP